MAATGIRLSVALLFATTFSAAQQTLTLVPVQSPRQAILEMVSGGEDKFKKHLTVEVQQKLDEIAKSSSPSNSMNPAQFLGMLKSNSVEKLDTFDTGRILFTVNNSAKHERFEIHVVGEDLRGNQDEMELSIHSFRSGVEEPMPVALRFLVSMKQQEGVWRLTALTISGRLPVGDPRILDKSFWTSATLASGSLSPADPVVIDDTPKMKPLRAVRMITLAESLYAQKHPGSGFTCALPELINIGKGLDNGETYQFMDPAFSSGEYNGYRFSVQGCQGQPVKTFQVVAEPLNGKGKAYCSDDRRNLRWSDDGQGTTCLASGAVARQ